jgi:hypothetical protein
MKEWSRPTPSQEKRIKDSERFIGMQVFLKGTKSTTKVTGVVKSINIIPPSPGERNMGINFNILWDSQDKPYVTERRAFEI